MVMLRRERRRRREGGDVVSCPFTETETEAASSIPPFSRSHHLSSLPLPPIHLPFKIRSIRKTKLQEDWKRKKKNKRASSSFPFLPPEIFHSPVQKRFRGKRKCTIWGGEEKGPLLLSPLAASQWSHKSSITPSYSIHVFSPSLCGAPLDGMEEEAGSTTVSTVLYFFLLLHSTVFYSLFPRQKQKEAFSAAAVIALPPPLF